ncbi:DNA cytosine methyltransferase [Alienimonas sp. DA493]|uniref:DNA cytosine methyltransferase n=1 Tax=Alienimonas sp. DA493 TaxID=3373605 RepID=UPI00375520E0
MKVLVACEFSGTVRDAFLRRGHDAMSCDLLPTESPGPHYQGDVRDAICLRSRWDLVVLHVPCTAMGVCGNGTYGKGNAKHHKRKAAVKWTLGVWDLASSLSSAVALENPASVIFPILRRERGAGVQYIQPWQFGHPEQKKTGLALRGVPRLVGTRNVYDEMMRLPRRERERIHFMSPSPDRGHERSRFFSGIAEAMAEQWGSPKPRPGELPFGDPIHEK